MSFYHARREGGHWEADDYDDSCWGKHIYLLAFEFFTRRFNDALYMISLTLTFNTPLMVLKLPLVK